MNNFFILIFSGCGKSSLNALTIGFVLTGSHFLLKLKDGYQGAKTVGRYIAELLQ